MSSSSIPNYLDPNIFPPSSNFIFSSSSSSEVALQKTNRNRLVGSIMGIVCPSILIVVIVSLKMKKKSYGIPLFICFATSIVFLALSANEISKDKNRVKKTDEDHQLSIAVVSINSIAILIVAGLAISSMKSLTSTVYPAQNLQ